MMLPILISVAVAPVSYLACSAACAQAVARIAMAAEKAPNRRWIAGILISLLGLSVGGFRKKRRLSRSWPAFNPRRGKPATKSPATRGAQRAEFSLRRIE